MELDENSNKLTHIYGHQIDDEGVKVYNGIKKVFSISIARKIGQLYVKE